MLSKIKHKRHIAKTLTWRVVGTLDTIVLSWIISGDPTIGMQIGLTESITKMVLYYLHERVWVKIYIANSRKRHLIKTVTWRVIGTLDTVLLSWFFTGNPYLGLQIGAAEVVTKMLLYYLHERLWYKINFGLDKRIRARKWKRT
ncbi:DUF2061 domain-containing protein [Aureicoccus marinus]|uniref:DUF2061 domain-containing protein n=1 Tax=Aureicoccus marinus TaxID=754435 RepID=A0A2S7T5N7_9FLAO|nr:DUF2061 domain-containing protein [Aureicoccus marinus]PQJ15250.1 hypothetical protein BST99_05465 [Aureicoccus marinus]